MQNHYPAIHIYKAMPVLNVPQKAKSKGFSPIGCSGIHQEKKTILGTADMGNVTQRTGAERLREQTGNTDHT